MNLVRLGCIAVLAFATPLRPAFAYIPSSNLVLWLRGDAGVEEATGDPAENNDYISAWLDQSGSGNDAVPKDPSGVITNRHAPKFVTNAVNGRDAVQFTLGVGGAEYARLGLDNPLLTGTTDYHIFAVVNFSQTGPNGEKVIGANYGLGNASGLEFYDYQQNLHHYKNGSIVGTNDIVDSTWHLIEARRIGTAVTLWVDGVEEATGTTASASIGSSRNWTIGNATDYPASEFGFMAEQIVYTNGLTGATRDLVVRRMADNYLLAIIPEPSALALLVVTSLLLRRRRMLRPTSGGITHTVKLS